jgi:arylformamidase
MSSFSERCSPALIDITRTITPELAVWPGDTPFGITPTATIAGGDSVNLTTLTLSAHTGSHADAPRHFLPDGTPIDRVGLEPYWGLAQVVTVEKSGGLESADFAPYTLSLAPRLLVRTPVQALPHSRFPHAFPWPTPALAAELARQGVILYGTDAPSMDVVDSADLPGHHALARHGIAILESLDLTDAPDGLYELVALPLKIAGGDGSPVRAVLRRIQDERDADGADGADKMQRNREGQPPPGS